MVLSNQDRELIMEEFTMLYGQEDLPVILIHMPKDLNDPDAKEFERYFNFIQLMFSLRSDIKSFSESQLDERLDLLKSLAKEYNYPTGSLEVFYGD